MLIMPRKTKAQIGLLLADYDAQNRSLRKLEQLVKSLKAEIDTLDLKEGPYGDMTLAYGTPREILDQQTARKVIVELGGTVPLTMTKAPYVIKPKAAK